MAIWSFCQLIVCNQFCRRRLIWPICPDEHLLPSSAGFCIVNIDWLSIRSKKMIKNQKLSEARAVRMPTLAEAMLDSLIKPSALTGAVMKAALVVFGSVLLAVSHSSKSRLSGASYRANTCCFADWHDIWGAPRGITIAAYLFEGALVCPYLPA